MRVDNKTTQAQVKKKRLYLLLDGSGSMQGAKWRATIAGVKKIIQENGGLMDIVIRKFSGRVSNCMEVVVEQGNAWDVDLGSADGSTPLFAEMTKLFNEIKAKGETNVIVNIFTDGEDDNIYNFNSAFLKALMKSLEQDVAITFSGTISDTNDMLRLFDLSEGNICAHDNTGESVENLLILLT